MNSIFEDRAGAETKEKADIFFHMDDQNFKFEMSGNRILLLSTLCQALNVLHKDGFPIDFIKEMVDFALNMEKIQEEKTPKKEMRIC